MKVTYSAAMSQDQFIARPDGDVDWLNDFEIAPDESGLAELFKSTDGLLIGRKSYDFVFQYGSWPYGDKPTWVCTSKSLEKMNGANLFITDSIDQVIQDAKNHGCSNLWLLGGGQLASSFLERGFITHISLTELPIRLEDGIPLFARHQLDEIECGQKSIIEKSNFRQFEYQLD